MGDIRQLVLDHKEDVLEDAVTGKYVLRWTESDDVDNSKRHRKSLSKNQGLANERKKALNAAKAAINSQGQGGGLTPSSQAYDQAGNVGNTSMKSGGFPEKTEKSPGKRMQSGNRRRRVRCKTCEKRRCLHPQLPVCAHCSICNLDGWFNTPKVQGKEAERPEEPPNLYECTVCLDIVHPRCVEKTIGLGQINHDLSNSWECAKCSNSGYSTVPSRQRRHNSGNGNGETEVDEPNVKKSKSDMVSPLN